MKKIFLLVALFTVGCNSKTIKERPKAIPKDRLIFGPYYFGMTQKSFQDAKQIGRTSGGARFLYVDTAYFDNNNELFYLKAFGLNMNGAEYYNGRLKNEFTSVKTALDSIFGSSRQISYPKITSIPHDNSLYPIAKWHKDNRSIVLGLKAMDIGKIIFDVSLAAKDTVREAVYVKKRLREERIRQGLESDTLN